MEALVQPGALVMLGLLAYVMAWLWHDSGKVGDLAWSRVPQPVHRLLRFRTGPLYASSVVVEVWGLVMFGAGVIGQFTSVGGATRRILLEGPLYLAIPVAVIWAILWRIGAYRQQ